MADKEKRLRKYSCHRCKHSVILYVKPSEPPMHKCGNSSQPKNWLPLQEIV